MKPSEFLKNKKNLSREEMQQYLEGNLSASEKRKAEEKLIDDEFSSEAADGFIENNISFAAIPSFSAAGGKTSAAKNGFNYKFWFFGAVIVATAAVIYLIVLISQPETENNNVVNNLPTDENNPENMPQLLGYLNATDIKSDFDILPKMYSREPNGIVLSDSQLKVEINEINKSTVIEKSKQITYEKTIAEQPKTIEVKEPEIIPEPIEVIDPKKPEEVNENNNEQKVVESNVKMLYIKNLKAVDYSIFYTSNVVKKEWLLTGLPADKETQDSEGTQIEQVVKYIPYKDFLTEYLTKFSKNDFKGALSGLLIIQQQFPDDLNAAFYSGLCYYNLGKNRQAIAAFDKALTNSFTTFREESEWYKALSLLEYGKKAEAKELMKKIEKENGFYAKKAKEKLSKMK